MDNFYKYTTFLGILLGFAICLAIFSYYKPIDEREIYSRAVVLALKDGKAYFGTDIITVPVTPTQEARIRLHYDYGVLVDLTFDKAGNLIKISPQPKGEYLGVF